MRCGKPPGPPVYRLEGAHVVRKGMGGRTGGEGYQVELCHDCHQGPQGVDRRQDATMAVRRDNRMPVWLEWDGQRITEHGLG